MRHLTRTVLFLLLLAPAAPAAATHGGAKPGCDDVRRADSRWDGRRHVVHEWGTFTTVQGSDGVTLGGLVHDTFDLPPFVYDLRERHALTGMGLKMETPVVYFYAPRPWRVRLRVDFPRGVISQWYPAATLANRWPERPSDVEADSLPVELEDGYVRWGRAGELLVLGPDERDVPLPEVAEDNPWRFSREVAANALRVTNPSWRRDESGRWLAESEAKQEYERFLFYRGLGDFELPLAAEVASEVLRDDDCLVTLALRNRTPDEPLTQLFLIHVGADRAGFLRLPDLASERPTQGYAIPLRPLDAAADALVEAISAGLAGTGLYADEAAAMANTWRHSWFEEEGLRALYVVPQTLVERELPLTVRPGQSWEWRDGERVGELAGPAPDEVLRTFVGRLDLISPERERGLADTIDACLSEDPLERRRAADEVAAWGRYAEPYLRRAAVLGVASPAIEAARSFVIGRGGGGAAARR